MKIIRKDSNKENKPAKTEENRNLGIFESIDRTFEELRNEIEGLFWGFPGAPAYIERGINTEFRAPYVDVIDRGDSLIVTAEMPGIPKENIDVQVDENSIEISGRSEEEKEEKDSEYYRKERVASSFYREIPLPEEVKPEEANAKFNNGILEIKLPKKVPTKASRKKKVNVQ